MDSGWGGEVLVKKRSIDTESFCSQRSSKLQIVGKYLIARTLKHGMSKSVDSLLAPIPWNENMLQNEKQELRKCKHTFPTTTATTVFLRNGDTSCVHCIQDFHKHEYALRVFGQTVLRVGIC